MGNTLNDTFEGSNKEDYENCFANLCDCMYFIIINDRYSEDKILKEKVQHFLKDKLKDLEPWKFSSSSLLKCTIEFCILEGLLIDTILIQGFIIAIQAQKLFEKYGLQATDKNEYSDYRVYRERYLNILTYCKTYHIIPEYSDYIETKLNVKQLKVDSIFDTIDLGENIKKLALKNIKI